MDGCGKNVIPGAKPERSDRIGVFDSGVGGLAVLAALRRNLPNEDFIYVFDRSHSPYGNRSAKYVATRADKITGFLCDKGVKAVVVACNTATSVGITALREKYDVPVIGIEPPLKPAAEAFPDGKIAVLVTPRTAREHRFIALFDRYGTKNTTVIPCPDLATAVETHFHDLDETIPLLKKYLGGCPNPAATVLGCTHYYFLRPQIKKILGDSAVIFDGADGVAGRVKSVLTESGSAAGSKTGKTEYFYL